MSNGSTTVTVIYDAMGRAVENQVGSTYTQIVYAPDGSKLALANGTSILVRAFIALPGGGRAIYNSSGLAYYQHGDWLGTSRLTTTPSRTVYSTGAYGPYGESYTQAGAPDVSFTGQTQDTVSGLYDFMYRRNNPVQGRWMSPDPAGLAAVDPSSPQTWNRYAYVGNDPLLRSDPLGLDDDCGGPCTPFSYNDGNCVTDVTYYNQRGPDGNTYDEPMFDHNCFRSPGPQFHWQVICGVDGCQPAKKPAPVDVSKPPKKPAESSAAKLRCEQKVLGQAVFAGLAEAKVSITGTADQVIDQAGELIRTPGFRIGAGALIQTGAVSVGITEGVGTMVAATFSEVIVPLAAAGFTGYSLYEFGKGFYNYADEHMDECEGL